MFRFAVEDVFAIKGRGALVTGKLTGGEKPKIGASVLIEVAGRTPVRSVVIGRPTYCGPVHGRPPRPVEADDLLLRGVSKEDVPIGAVITSEPELAQ
jgi:translation elongation factor EF-Tu-like GTPase